MILSEYPYKEIIQCWFGHVTKINKHSFEVSIKDITNPDKPDSIMEIYKFVLGKNDKKFLEKHGTGIYVRIYILSYSPYRRDDCKFIVSFLKRRWTQKMLDEANKRAVEMVKIFEELSNESN